jgi:hypothetical protein
VLVLEATALDLGQVQLDVGRGAGANARARRLQQLIAELEASRRRVGLRAHHLQADIGAARDDARVEPRQPLLLDGDGNGAIRLAHAHAALTADLDHLLESHRPLGARRRRPAARLVAAMSHRRRCDRVGRQQHARAHPLGGDDVARAIAANHERRRVERSRDRVALGQADRRLRSRRRDRERDTEPDRE